MCTKIWKIHISLQQLQERCQEGLIDHLQIEFTKIGDDYLQASMPVEPRVMQPMGIMHGGASCALAETVASAAAHHCIDPKVSVCVGIEINVNHIKAVKSGTVIATARPYHLGRLTQVWSIEIHDDEGHLISVGRQTTAVLERF